jgi:NAD(P)H dehydrogenase (quinone)
MRVLTIYASSNPQSFCHAVLEQFTRGLKEAGHESEVVDLYAIKFNPVFDLQDGVFFAHETVPAEMLEAMNLKEGALSLARGPLRRFLLKRWLQDKGTADLLKLFREHQPKDVLEQQAKVARADALAFVAPIYWMGFPAILKGWIERVFSYGFAYSLTPNGWNGEVSGRVPLLQHKKALILSTTFFQESDYREGYGAALRKVIDEWCFHYPGIQQVEHEYFYATPGVDDAARQGYLQRAYQLGQEF